MLMLEENLVTPEEFAHYQTELNNKLQSVSILIDNMLYWAQNQMKGEYTLNIEEVSIKRKVERALSVLQSAATQKGVELVDNVGEDIKALADKDHLDIVIRNLVSNAIKFTRPGGHITLDAEQRGNKTAIIITDTGVGMTAEQIGQLHTEKTQISTKGTDGEKGTGLGLRLCYQLVQKNNGELLVSSIPGKGTMFTILLPSA
jgi:signal transduction histidine kinase